MIHAKEWITDVVPREELLGSGWGGDWVFESSGFQWPYPMAVFNSHIQWMSPNLKSEAPKLSALPLPCSHTHFHCLVKDMGQKICQGHGTQNLCIRQGVNLVLLRSLGSECFWFTLLWTRISQSLFSEEFPPTYWLLSPSLQLLPSKIGIPWRNRSRGQ